MIWDRKTKEALGAIQIAAIQIASTNTVLQ